jgi:nifR3 family TIM-barrel protein
MGRVTTMTSTVSAARALRIGPHVVDTPVVLAPMAGITNQAFRRLCREYGAGIYVSEMVTSRALVERTAESMRLIRHDADESPRSVQLYGVDPVTVGAAVRMLVEEDRADHVDLNFGCPVAKVTRKGGGAALPWKLELFTAIVRAAVRAAQPAGIPVTVKMRKGIDGDHLTYLDAGRAAQAEGAAAVALHARTAADYYGGTADWTAIARLKEVVTEVPVLGNGDIWSAEDALAMVEQTGCDGVVVGRGCLGRPWLFGDLAAGFAGRPQRHRPTLGQAVAALQRHAHLLAEHYGEESKACRDIRKHVAWYLKGYVVGHRLRASLGLVETLEQLGELLGGLELDQPYPGEPAEGPRGRTAGAKRVALPEGWLEHRQLTGAALAGIREAELSVSGG